MIPYGFQTSDISLFYPLYSLSFGIDIRPLPNQRHTHMHTLFPIFHFKSLAPSFLSLFFPYLLPLFTFLDPAVICLQLRICSYAVTKKRDQVTLVSLRLITSLKMAFSSSRHSLQFFFNFNFLSSCTTSIFLRERESLDSLL